MNKFFLIQLFKATYLCGLCSKIKPESCDDQSALKLYCSKCNRSFHLFCLNGKNDVGSLIYNFSCNICC